MDVKPLDLSYIFQDRKPLRINKYNIVAVEGLFGSGKTALLTWLGVNAKDTAINFNRDFEYEYIYANYHLKNIPDFKYLNPALTKKQLFEYVKPKSLLLIDEADEYFSNRESMGTEHNERLRFFYQVRKIDCDVVLNIPSVFWLDKRNRGITTEFYTALGETFKGSGLYKYGELLYIGGNYEIGRTFEIDLQEIYPYYDHRERVLK